MSQTLLKIINKNLKLILKDKTLFSMHKNFKIINETLKKIKSLFSTLKNNL